MPRKKWTATDNPLRPYSKLIGALVGAALGWAAGHGAAWVTGLDPVLVTQACIALGGAICTYFAPKNIPAS